MPSELNPEGAFRRARLISRILAGCLVGVLIWRWRVIPTLFRVAPWSPVGIVLMLFLGLLIGSVVGLVRMRRWGFYCAYLLVPVSTILHGIALVPFITDLLPDLELRIWSVALLNLAFLIAAAVAHRAYNESFNAREADGQAAVHPAP